MTEAIMSTYQRLPVTFERGEGAFLWDDACNIYLDALSGIAVCGLGHAHPGVAAALCDQASLLLHTSNLYHIPLQEKLGQRLTALSGMDKVFFANSGAEANEAAIKLARLYGHQRGIESPTIAVAENSFHGRTMATLSATGSRKVQAGFEPLVQGFARVPFNDIQTLETLAENSPEVVAVLLEPVQGEGGIRIPDPGYLRQVRDLCDRQGWLMMLDEIQTGMGRSGRLFAFQHEGITPDVMTLAKALGNGVPIGACLARGKAANTLQPGQHGSTFGGSPLACRAGLAVLDTLENDALVERAAQLGAHLLAELQTQLTGLPGVVEVRGLGLLLGIELDRPCSELVHRALDRCLLINVTAGNVIRLLPPLVMDDQQAGQLIDTLGELVRAFLSEPAVANG